MKKCVLIIALLLVSVLPAHAVSTWHILLTGGTATQCTGLVNAAYPGSGSAQPCALQHPFWLMNTSTGAWSLLGAGDTIEFDDAGPYYLGQQHSGLGTFWSFCAGNETQCFMPPYPTGVTVKGLGFGACHDPADPFWNHAQGSVPENLINSTQLTMLNGAAFAATFDSTNNVTFGCFHITQPETCSLGTQQFNSITNTSKTGTVATYSWSAGGAYPAPGEFTSVSGTTNGGGAFNFTHRQVIAVTGFGTSNGTFTVGGFASGTVTSAADTGLQTWDGTCVQGTNNFGRTGIQFAFSNDQGPSNLLLEDVAIEGIGVNGTLGSHFNTSLNITSVANASGGNTVYTGTFPACGSNACVGKSGVFQEFSHTANSNDLVTPTFTVSASTTTTLTVNNPSGVAETTTTGITSFDKVTISYLYLIGNGSAGFNSDSGVGGTTQENVGQLLVDHMAIIANGCAAITGASTYLGNGFNWCSAQPYNGYGDGLVLIASKGFSKFTTVASMINTQDGFDGLHFGDDLAAFPLLQVTHAFAYGNGGQSLKGGGGHDKFQNSIGITNCNLLGVESNFPSNPAGWSALIGVGSPGTCRASDGMAFAMTDGDTLELDNMTNIVDSVDSGIDIAPAGGGDCTSAATCVAIMRNVANLGFPNPLTSIPAGGLSILTAVDPFGNPGSSITNNSWFGFRSNICPQDSHETNTVCTDPKFTSESSISTMNVVPLSTSPLNGAGTTYTGVPATDFYNVNYSVPPPIGAVMQSGAAAPTTQIIGVTGKGNVVVKQ